MENLSLREVVEVIGGKWVGHKGSIVAISNRTDGKAGYKIYSDSGEYIHCLKKFVVPIEYPKAESNKADENSVLCKWVRVESLANVVEESRATSVGVIDHRILCRGKMVLVTDEWEEDGRILLNVVFQGNHAILPKSDVYLASGVWCGLV